MKLGKISDTNCDWCRTRGYRWLMLWRIHIWTRDDFGIILACANAVSRLQLECVSILLTLSHLPHNPLMISGKENLLLCNRLKVRKIVVDLWVFPFCFWALFYMWELYFALYAKIKYLSFSSQRKCTSSLRNNFRPEEFRSV